MNTENTTPDTLRNRLIKPFPDMTITERYIPNPSDELDEHGYRANFIPNPDCNFPMIDQLFMNATIWTALNLAQGYTYHSDSTIDSHYAIIASITELNNVVYRHNLTMDLDEAVNRWLDDVGICIDLIETANPNTGMTDEIDQSRPELFTYFNLDYDFFDEDYEPRS